jgi:hypothetical protein
MGALSVFAAQGRDQFLLEGVIVALLTLSLSLTYYFLRLSTKLRFPLVRHVLVLLFLAIFCTLGVELWQAYVLKTPWYSLRDTMPAELWRLLTSSVKKNSGVGKRLLRLSEIWLFEAKDFATFQKKVETLLLDYLRRQWSTVAPVSS